MSLFPRFLVVLALSAFAAGPALAATWHVRPDGGSAAQCTGFVDAPYPGSGLNQPCALSHPFWALDGAEPPNWRLQGGDRLIIAPGAYMLGYGAPNSEWCSADYPWDCALPALPSGPSPQTPTVLAGKNWDQGCPARPELWGVERVHQLVSLNGSNNVTVACLELTDHAGCAESHPTPEAHCERDSFPHGDWAANGVAASDSANATLQDLDIHGLANAGVLAGRLTDWTVTRVRVAGNGWVGWDGDIDGEDDNQGELRFTDFTVEWNGCVETWPGEEPSHCWGQAAGGYGDGLGTGATGGHWIFEKALFQYNTSDGLDLLYLGDNGLGGRASVDRLTARSNAGNQVKISGPTEISNAELVGDCAYFEGKAFAPDIDGAAPLTHCRASGNALSLNFTPGDHIKAVNLTVTGQGDCLAELECRNGSCDGSERLDLVNSIFLGGPDYTSAGDATCWFWVDPTGLYAIVSEHNLVHGVKFGAEPSLGGDDLQLDPLLRDDKLASFDARLKSASPARDSGADWSGQAPDHDIAGRPRPIGPGLDRGAWEWTPDLAGTRALLLSGETSTLRAGERPGSRQE